VLAVRAAVQRAAVLLYNTGQPRGMLLLSDADLTKCVNI
jgi:hypothetical protein